MNRTIEELVAETERRMLEDPEYVTEIIRGIDQPNPSHNAKILAIHLIRVMAKELRKR